MPKKRKDRRPNVPLQTGPVPIEMSEPAVATRPAAAVHHDREPARPGAGSQSVIKADYTTVIADLKRIAVLGGGLIAVLVALSFIIK